MAKYRCTLPKNILMSPIWHLQKTARLLVLMICMTISLQSCYSYRIATHAQAGTEPRKATAHSFFWGLVQTPKDGIKTPNCDSLNINGMSDVKVKTNLGYALITVCTLGMWAPVQLEYKCGKPCQVVGRM
jgi:hypothetical protein